MTNYAVVHFYEFEQALQMVVLKERFSGIKEAEGFRGTYLRAAPLASPQEIQVIQYVVESTRHVR